MSRDKKIEKINSYHKLLATGKLPPNKDGDTVAAEINQEFRSWVESQLASLLGEGGAAASSGLALTEDEIAVLKTLVNRAVKRAGQVPESKKTGTAVVKDRPRESGRPMPRPNVAGKDILSALEEMDLMGSRYLEE